MEILQTWNPDQFFTHFWNKKPCIITGINYSQLIASCDINELSSLALEEDIVSRIIRIPENNYHQTKIEFGPFKENQLNSLPQESPWALLVQDVDKKTDLFDSFLENFSRIPKMYFDDVMVSIGNKGSGTGPHLDWYNVFIVQTHGSKSWKVEKNKRTFEEHNNDIHDDLEIKLLKSFGDHDTHELLPGEILYIPPGHGHHGISTSELSMSLSIGFQGPRLITMIETYLSKVLKDIHEDQRIDFEPNNESKMNLNAWPKEIIINDQDLLSRILKLAKEQDY